jgi:hypothetical protein
MKLRKRSIPRDGHGVWGDLVACPYRGRDVSLVDDCLSCPMLKTVDLDGPQPWVRCRRPSYAEDLVGVPGFPRQL